VKKKILSICLSVVVLVALIVVLVPGCTPTEEQGTIEVKATLCDVAWQGAVSYTLTPASGSPVNGTSVPSTHSVAAGNWTCAYVSGGPAGAYLVDITPDPTQEVSEGGTITFTLNFELDQDAWIEFDTWTINGEPWEYLEAEVMPCNFIDVHFTQGVLGCPERVVAVNETSWLKITQTAGLPGVKIHVVNDWCALNKTPEPIEKESQVPSFKGEPVEKDMSFPLDLGVPVNLDVETIWQLVKETDYTKSINWFGIWVGEYVPELHPCVLFELIVPGPGVYTFILQASAEVELMDDEDVDIGNNDAEGPPLTLTVFVP